MAANILQKSKTDITLSRIPLNHFQFFHSIPMAFNIDYPGWGAIRKWPLIRPSPTHTVCSRTKIIGSGIWFERTIVWSDVSSIGGWYDQRSLRSGDGMIRGHFGLGMAWSEVTSGWDWSDQRWIQANIILIRDQFELKFFFDFLFFYREMLTLPRGNKEQHSDHRHISSFMALIRTKEVQLIKHASLLTRKFCWESCLNSSIEFEICTDKY